MSKKEAAIVYVLSLILALGIGFIGEIKVSGKTTIQQETIKPFHKVWNDGMGTTVHINYVSPHEIEGYESWSNLIKDYTFFFIRVEQDKNSTFLMVDMNYDRMTLHDNHGRTYRLVNTEVEAATQNKELKSLLKTFHWTMFNQAFPGGKSLALHELIWEGILVFEPVENDADTLSLQLVYSMTGQKTRYICSDCKCKYR